MFYAHLPSTARALASGIAIITAALAVAYLLLVSAFQLSLLASGSCNPADYAHEKVSSSF